MERIWHDCDSAEMRPSTKCQCLGEKGIRITKNNQEAEGNSEGARESHNSDGRSLWNHKKETIAIVHKVEWWVIWDLVKMKKRFTAPKRTELNFLAFAQKAFGGNPTRWNMVVGASLASWLLLFWIAARMHHFWIVKEAVICSEVTEQGSTAETGRLPAVVYSEQLGEWENVWENNKWKRERKEVFLSLIKWCASNQCSNGLRTEVCFVQVFDKIFPGGAHVHSHKVLILQFWRMILISPAVHIWFIMEY